MKINAIDMVRKIRDVNHLKTNGLSPKEKLEATKKIAKKFSEAHRLNINLKVKNTNNKLTNQSI